jgi:hypothetical protein
MAITHAAESSGDPTPSVFRRALRAIEPWYHWGTTFIERLDGDGEGPGYHVSLQWLGVSFTLFFGRTPRRDQRGC